MKASSTLVVIVKKNNECFNECSNISLNDLIAHDKPSMEINTLLGLGLKLCTKSRVVQMSNTIRRIGIFKSDVRLKDYLMSNIFDEDD